MTALCAARLPAPTKGPPPESNSGGGPFVRRFDSPSSSAQAGPYFRSSHSRWSAVTLLSRVKSLLCRRSASFTFTATGLSFNRAT